MWWELELGTVAIIATVGVTFVVGIGAGNCDLSIEVTDAYGT